MFHQKTACLLAVLTLSVALVGCSKSETQDLSTSMTHEHSDPATQSVDAPIHSVAATPAPTLKMTVDVSQQAATIHFATTNFKISPEHYSQPHVPGEGHIHLFVDGSPTKVAVKEVSYKLDHLTPGHHKLKASLHTNNHQPYNVEDAIEFDVK
ncbi:hypothetical protein [Tumebacillus permanentifrigoris]|uniref:DUF4399 domain-containing protein n=1 Tax=Tumebacillus permanentifrigoris TaxID=378543 RepID=A0A316D8D2_9BACL|nr:hypothetical protein [Tumebacillus permanentifrigoris]PWK09698.1 hypothetical protein C7459_113136 [Tumebacillus permanentifrigoris]